MAAETLGNGAPDGTVLGRTDDKIGFYGATPIVTPTVAVTASTPNAAELAADMIALRTALVNLGLIDATEL